MENEPTFSMTFTANGETITVQLPLSRVTRDGDDINVVVGERTSLAVGRYLCEKFGLLPKTSGMES